MSRRRRELFAFAAWAVVGLTAILGALSILTIGIFVLPGAALLAGYLARRVRSAQAGPGLLTGAGVMLLIVACLNRGGPGTVCTGTTSAGGASCAQELSPWPWMTTGLCLIAAGVALGVILQARRNSASPPPRQ
jgi:hypothetical protein